MRRQSVLAPALTGYLAQVPDRVIREAVYRDTEDADAMAWPTKIGP